MMQLLHEVVRATIYTGFIQECDPLSLLLIAPPENCKTSVVLQNPSDSCLIVSDITGRGLQKLASTRPEIRHFVINDLIAVTSHRPTVSQYAISVLNALTEEGLYNIVTPDSIEKFEHATGRRGVITSLTPEVCLDGRRWWIKIGFTSRMLPFAFYLSNAIVLDIKKLIENDNGHKHNPPKVINGKMESVKITDPVRDAIRHIADERARVLGEVGIRRLKQYRTLARGRALSIGRNIVTEADVKWIHRVDQYVSYTTLKEL